tara:strand:- start:1543 stop:2529 length:987 start_codon:yes stop_codon:yes gene_type:complete
MHYDEQREKELLKPWLMQGDCLERMKEIESGSVDMILTDPPYGTVKGMVLKGQTKDTTKWDTTINREEMLNECNRILRTNGCLVLFSQDPYTYELAVNAHNNVPFSYRLTWLKDHFASPLSANKAPVNYTEDVCVFFKKHTKHDFEGFHPLRDYAKSVCEFIGMSKKAIFKDMGHQGMCHFMRHNSTQFNMCTEKTYGEIISRYGIESMKGFQPFNELKPVDEKYREDLIKKMTNASPKVFNLPCGENKKSNVLSYKKDYQGLHPTQKPVLLLEDLIKTYTNETETVLDFTMGSGSTGVACKNLNRKFIGIELDEEYFKIAQDRISAT